MLRHRVLRFGGYFVNLQSSGRFSLTPVATKNHHAMTTQEFIALHASDDVRRLALQAPRYPDVDMPYALDQIAGRQTARRKLPSWAAADGMVYPPRLSMEQCSSEPAARYKAALVARLLHDLGVSRSEATLADLTGGFGVDFSFLAPLFGRASYVERDDHLCRVASHNFGRLALTHATVTCAQAEDQLERMPPHTVVFLDPARRDTHGSKTVAIADCTPDAAALMPLLAAKARLVVIKLSPMLDWHKAVADLGPAVSEVHIVSVGGECKELLIVAHMSRLAPGATPCTAPGCPLPAGDAVDVVCADVPNASANTAADASQPLPGVHTFAFKAASGGTLPPQIVPVAPLPQPPFCLYEPGAAVMKAGCFGLLARRYSLSAVAANSHLFFSQEMCADFPGRKFTVYAVSTMNRRMLRAALGHVTRANVAVRNFPLSADALRRRLKLADGGDTYIFATTAADGTHVLLLARK